MEDTVSVNAPRESPLGWEPPISSHLQEVFNKFGLVHIPWSITVVTIRKRTIDQPAGLIVRHIVPLYYELTVGTG